MNERDYLRRMLEVLTPMQHKVHKAHAELGELTFRTRETTELDAEDHLAIATFMGQLEAVYSEMMQARYHRRAAAAERRQTKLDFGSPKKKEQPS